jgi:hypothetical protein
LPFKGRKSPYHQQDLQKLNLDRFFRKIVCLSMNFERKNREDNTLLSPLKNLL